MNDLKELSEHELREILITCDGKGKEVKIVALERLLDLEFRRGIREERLWEWGI